VVHITSCLTLSASVIASAKKCNLPVVLTLTDFWFVCHKLSLLRYDGSLCNGVTTSRDCIQCLCWESSAYQRVKRFASAPVATGVFDILSRFPSLNQQRGLRGMALNIPQRKEFLASMLDAVDIVIAPSNHLYQTLRRSGVKREMRVIQSGHDLSWLKAPLVKSRSNWVRFGYIGQFIPTKGVHTLLEAFGSRDWQGQAELHLFGNQGGEGAYWHRLQQIENRNPGAVVFHGPFPHEKLDEILSGLDVLIVPSLWHENNPRVVQEAFASKTPVIASDVGGISEYVKHEVNGYLFQRGDSLDLQRQIRRLVEDPARLEQLIGRLPAVKTMSNEIDEIESCYQQLFPETEA
jgi:glycosyltransferase involved in cell wall biosynthesis